MSLPDVGGHYGKSYFHCCASHRVGRVTLGGHKDYRSVVVNRYVGHTVYHGDDIDILPPTQSLSDPPTLELAITNIENAFIQIVERTLEKLKYDFVMTYPQRVQYYGCRVAIAEPTVFSAMD